LPGAICPAPLAAIKADLDRVSAGAEELRQYAERTRAHRTPEGKFDPAVTTFGALHQALDSVREVIQKYYALITQGIIDRWEAVPQFNTIRPFERPWVEDPDAVKRVDQKGPRHKCKLCPCSLAECLGLSRRRTGGKSQSRSPMAATLRLTLRGKPSLAEVHASAVRHGGGTSRDTRTQESCLTRFRCQPAFTSFTR
jgi:hypothetical protein